MEAIYWMLLDLIVWEMEWGFKCQILHGVCVAKGKGEREIFGSKFVNREHIYGSILHRVYCGGNIMQRIYYQ